MILIIKKIISYPLEFLFFFYELFFFKIRKKNSSGSYSYMLRFFYFTGGLSNDVINFFVSKKPKNTFFSEGLLSKYKNNSIKSYQEKLEKNGYVVFENILNDIDINNLISELKKKEGFYLSDNKGLSIKQKLDFNDPKAVMFYYSSQDIIDTDSFHKILFDPSLIKFSQDYLKSYPVIDNISAWWSFPAATPEKNAAQWWHFDLERPKWLKFFFFLTDCTIETGAHCFIKGSQKNNGVKWSLRKKGYTRLSDQEIEKNYKKDQIISVTAKRGSLLVEDTRGLHKGLNLTRDHRLLIQVQYASSTFGAKVEKFKLPKIRNNNFLDLKNKFNYTYSLFK
tara:strand:- start:6246 stop:7256 length:1011 start_codon:yes stop_codon:yes gene_type:complete